MPAAPAKSTEPRYLVPVVSPLNDSPIESLEPSVAVAGALTVTLPADAEPSTHPNRR